ncbi:sodium channel protein Nach-like [Anopheles marshallii]|uniref:sodium channel protein Nach-like n=1 Tax=Anopheles marshallii TaxID=1521116 RepID=UPI00237B2806|nr:sodium channel protein Nach-like [Anopheles marshallii]
MMKANAPKRRKLSTISSRTVATVHARDELPQTRGNLRERYRFMEELFQLFGSITAHCYRQLAQKDRTVWERLFWLLMLILEAATLVAIIISAWGKFTANPLITTLHDTIYPIELVPFPAISLCNNNRISRTAALRYARLLAEKDTADRRNVSYYLDQIVLLGKLYDFDYENLHQMTKFQEYLDLHDVSNGTGMYNALETLAKLSPRCEDMLLRCFWKSIELPCMLRNDMIEVRRTQYGFCCTFNFIGHNEDSEIHPPSYFLDVTGPEMGLVLLLNGSSNDYFYNLFNNIGFNVRVFPFLSILQIFNPNEVPDSTAGGVNEQFVHLGTETFIRIDAITINSEPDVLRYSRQKRQCVFRSELLKYGANYGRSNCVAACRLRSVMALCECVPFYMPTAGASASSKSITTCNLQHIACLNKYKIKWSTVITDIVRIPGLEKEMEESLYCPECLPSCSASKYQITASELPLIRSRRDGFSITAGIDRVEDVAVVRIFFGQPETWMYKQDVAYYWFEIFSNFGGMFGIMAGMSLITLMEVVYFVGRQLVLVFATRSWSARLRARKPTTLELLQ